MEPPKQRQNTITEYSIQERNIIGNVQEIKEDYDLMTAVMICLDDENEQPQNEILKLLSTVLDKEMTPVQKKTILQNEFNIKMTEELESEVTTMCNLAEGIYEKGAERKELENIKNLMETLNLDVTQAMAALKIPESSFERYTKLVSQK